MALDKIRTELIADDAVTAAKIPTGAIGTTEIAEGALSVHALQNTTSHTLSGTYSDSKMYTSDTYVLGGNITVNSNLVLSSVKGDDSDITLTDDGTTRTITGTGKLEAGAILAKERSDLTGMTGELGSVVTGSPNLNLTTGTLGSGVTFPGINSTLKSSGCFVYPSSNLSCGGGAWTQVKYDTERFDLGNEYDTAGGTTSGRGRWTTAVAGYYMIFGCLTFSSMPDGKKMMLQILKNNSTLNFSRNHSGLLEDCSVQTSSFVHLAANDYIEFQIFNGHSSAVNHTSGSTNTTFMWIARLS